MRQCIVPEVAVLPGLSGSADGQHNAQCLIQLRGDVKDYNWKVQGWLAAPPPLPFFLYSKKVMCIIEREFG